MKLRGYGGVQGFRGMSCCVPLDGGADARERECGAPGERAPGHDEMTSEGCCSAKGRQISDTFGNT